MKKQQLQAYLAKFYSLEEMKSFCFKYERDLNLQSLEVASSGDRNTEARELTQYCDRRGKITQLRKALYDDRPKQYLDYFPEDKNFVIENPSDNLLGESEILPIKIPDCVSIPAGEFWLGSNIAGDNVHVNETPRHIARTDAFQISKYPITNTQYATFVQSKQHIPPPHWDNGDPPQNKLDHPVVNVDYVDAQTYCSWLSQETGNIYRLPTEPEWEKAARGKGENSVYPWGDIWQPTFCNSIESDLSETAPITRYEKHNCSVHGVVDVVGNVWEWTSSWYQAYPGNTYHSSHYGYIYRVVRGGSYHNKNPQIACRIPCRGRYKPEIKRLYLGFRIVAIS